MLQCIFLNSAELKKIDAELLILKEYLAIKDYEIVSASKYLQKIGEIPSSISVINSNQIENLNAKNLIELLKILPGVEVYRTMDGYYEVSMRGIRSKTEILFMLNGHRINSFYDGNIIYNLPVEMIERVEVIHGPGSSIHGTNAFLGIINIITKKYTGENAIQLNYGSWDTWEFSLFLGKKIDEKNHLTIFSNYNKTDGDDSLRIKHITSSKIFANDENEQSFIHINLDNDNKTYSLNYIEQNRDVFLGQNYYYGNDEQYNKEKKLILDYKNERKDILDDLDYTFKFYGDFSKNQQKNYQGSIVNGSDTNDLFSKINYNSLTIGTEFKFNYKGFEKHKMVSGIQLEYLSISDYQLLTNFEKPRDLIYTPELTSPSTIFLFGSRATDGTYKGSFANYHNIDFPQNNYRYTLGIYFQDEWIITKKLIATLGGRLDSYNDFGTSINPKVGLVSPLRIGKNVDISLKTYYATAFRASTFQELYDRSQIATKNGSNGNEKLDAEKIRTFEIGTEMTFLKKWRYTLTFFVNKIEDRIYSQNITRQDGPLNKFDAYFNVGDINVKGFEWSLRYDYDKQNYCFANFSYNDAENEGGFIVSENNGIPEITDYTSKLTEVPQKRYNAGITFDASFFGLFKKNILKNFVITGTYNYGSERLINILDISPTTGFSYSNSTGKRWKIADYEIYNLSLNTTDYLSKTYSLKFSVYNLKDEKLYDNYRDITYIALSGTDFSEENVFKKSGRYYEAAIKVKF
jgi:iron complex outermembrane receptor protein